jgi:hypothetical protein
MPKKVGYCTSCEGGTTQSSSLARSCPADGPSPFRSQVGTPRESDSVLALSVILLYPLPFLDLFCSPTSICVSHIRRRLNLRCKFEGAISQSNSGHNQSSDESESIALDDDRADENVD